MRTVRKFTVVALVKSEDKASAGALVLKGPLVRPGDRDDVLGSFKTRFA